MSAVDSSDHIIRNSRLACTSELDTSALQFMNIQFLIYNLTIFNMFSRYVLLRYFSTKVSIKKIAMFAEVFVGAWHQI